MNPLTIEQMEDYIIRWIVANPKGLSFNNLMLCTWNYAFFHNTKAWDYRALKKTLGRLLIEKKIDFNREGLWAPVK